MVVGLFSNLLSTDAADCLIKQTAYQSESISASIFGSREHEPYNSDGESGEQGLNDPDTREVAIFLTHEVAFRQRGVLREKARLVFRFQIHVCLHLNSAD